MLAFAEFLTTRAHLINRSPPSYLDAAEALRHCSFHTVMQHSTTTCSTTSCRKKCCFLILILVATLYLSVLSAFLLRVYHLLLAHAAYHSILWFVFLCLWCNPSYCSHVFFVYFVICTCSNLIWYLLFANLFTQSFQHPARYCK